MGSMVVKEGALRYKAQLGANMVRPPKRRDRRGGRRRERHGRGGGPVKKRPATPLQSIRLLFATTNAGKLRELRGLAGPSVEVLSSDEALPDDQQLPEFIEDADTFVGNALKKACSAHRVTGLDVVADDSGLCVDALDGAPGVISARFAGAEASDDANTALLLERLHGVETSRRGAGFMCALVLVGPLADGPRCGRTEDGIAWRAFFGNVRGRITEEKAGAGGFGYDPVFFSPELGMTFGEAGADAKQSISHRGRALRQLAGYLVAKRVRVRNVGRPLFLRQVGLNALASAFEDLIRRKLRYADKAMELAFGQHPELGGKERAAVADLFWNALRKFDHLTFAVAALTGNDSSDPRQLRPRDAALLATMAAASVDPAGAPVQFGSGKIKTALDGLLDRQKDLSGRIPVRRDALMKALHKAHRRLQREVADGRSGFHPDFIAAARDQLGPDHAAWALDYLNSRGPLTLRARPDPGVDAVAQELHDHGIHAVRGTGPHDLICVHNARVTVLPGFKAGHFEIQDAGSQRIAVAVRARPGQTVIDWCAGAGGKTLAIAAGMEGHGNLFALDIHNGRLNECRRRLQRAGADWVQVLNHGKRQGKDDRLPAADIVLVDAPCSSSGALRRNSELRWHLDSDWLDRFADQQLAIIERAALHVRPGGRLVYATCSILPAENEVVARRFVDPRSDWSIVSEERTGPGDPTLRDANPLAEIGPDGFYFAVLQRQEGARETP